MTTSWIDAIGPSVVAALAKEYSIQLTPELVQFLNLYGDRVDAAGRSKAVGARKAIKIRQELDQVVHDVRSEVHRLRADQNSSVENQITELYVITHIETYLPVVYCRLHALPMLIIHVDRFYSENRKLIHGLGFRSEEYCGGKLPGRVGRAANYLRATCRKQKWQLSVTEVLKIWLTTALDIPLKDRQAASVTAGKHSLSQTRPRVKRSPDTARECTEVVSPFPHRDTNSTTEPRVVMDHLATSGSSPRKTRRRKLTPNYGSASETERASAAQLRKRTAVSLKREDGAKPRHSSPNSRPRKYPKMGTNLEVDLGPTSSAMLRASVSAALSAQDNIRTRNICASAEATSNTTTPSPQKAVAMVPTLNEASDNFPSSVPMSRNEVVYPTTHIPDTFSQFSADAPPPLFPNLDHMDGSDILSLKMEPRQFFKDGEEVVASGGRVDDFLSNFNVGEGISRDPSVPLGEMFLFHHEEVIATGGGEPSADATKLSDDHVQATRTEKFEQTSQPSKQGDGSLQTGNVDVAPKVVMANDRHTNSETHTQLDTKSPTLEREEKRTVAADYD